MSRPACEPVNQVVLTAQLVERASLRYTPAGLPALDVKLAHSGPTEHNGVLRTVSFEIHATALGDTVTTLHRMEIGAAARFSGFLAKQRNGRGVMLHVRQIDGIDNVPVLSDSN
ncbi:primosomal replication protein N [Leptothrix ochracea]|uniref:primosomal replication protein N n=1 Tax=Leptothrix ochracea TaxID=735331 RepID=UPI0034E1DF7F